MKDLIDAIAKLPWVLWCSVIIVVFNTFKSIIDFANACSERKQLKHNNKKATKRPSPKKK